MQLKRVLMFVFASVLLFSVFSVVSAIENASEDSLLTSVNDNAPEKGEIGSQEIKKKAGTVPGEAFYFLDRAFDIFQSSEKLADERAYELAVLANKTDVKNKTLERARERYEKVIKKRERKANKSEENAEKVTNQTTKHLEVLSRVYENVPEQAKGAIEKAMNNSMKGRENSINSLRQFNESKAEKVKQQTDERIKNKISIQMRNRIHMKELEEAHIRAMRMNIKCGLFPEEFNVSDLPEEIRNKTKKEKVSQDELLEILREMVMGDTENIQEDIKENKMTKEQIQEMVQEKIKQRTEFAKDTAEIINEKYGRGMGYWKTHYNCPKNMSGEQGLGPGNGQMKNNTSCETVEDCEGLHHIAVPGEWACIDNECVWETKTPGKGNGDKGEDSEEESGNNDAEKECAEEGEKFSDVYTEEYPEECCEGLTEWESGMDTRISIGNECYKTNKLSGNPVGTCIKTKDGNCSDLENPCNSPEDCGEGQNSDYGSVEEFCNKGYDSYCGESPETESLEICELC
ncbi:MAG TPA: hypothetical protein VJ912_00800 [Candidatus Nanoarchaeia archaeon]|nr:hypothetical protein [Candidatus Nanoarchaeia archaeon]